MLRQTSPGEQYREILEFRHKAAHVLGYMMQEHSKQCTSHPKEIVEIIKSEAFENILFLTPEFKKMSTFAMKYETNIFPPVFTTTLRHFFDNHSCKHSLVLIPNGSIYQFPRYGVRLKSDIGSNEEKSQGVNPKIFSGNWNYPHTTLRRFLQHQPNFAIDSFLTLW